MSHIGAIGGGASASGVPRPRQVNREESLEGASSSHAQSRAQRRGADSVEVSDLAQSLARASNDAPIRQDLVDRVRSQIEAGTYVTPARIDDAITNILRELESQT